MSRLFGGVHKCAVPGCRARIPHLMVLCLDHFGMVPSGFRQKLLAARDYGLQWRCHPTQDYLALRDQAIQIATREAARRCEEPRAQQLPLIPTP